MTDDFKYTIQDGTLIIARVLLVDRQRGLDLLDVRQDFLSEKIVDALKICFNDTNSNEKAIEEMMSLYKNDNDIMQCAGALKWAFDTLNRNKYE